MHCSSAACADAKRERLIESEDGDGGLCQCFLCLSDFAKGLSPAGHNADAEANRQAYGVSFDLAKTVFKDPFGPERVDDREEYSEERLAWRRARRAVCSLHGTGRTPGDQPLSYRDGL